MLFRSSDFSFASNDPGREDVNRDESWDVFGLLDHGDFIGVEGGLFITNTGELSIHVDRITFLAKAMIPMPDKIHGIADAEIRQRQRYADLAVHPEVRALFTARSAMIRSIRAFLDGLGYLEVETPVLQPLYGGALAKPFETHHNALAMKLFLRIADELYLKRLIVGGLERVYEIGHDFRNEGIDRTHNPEFTMLEFYQAYADYQQMATTTRELIQEAALAAAVTGMSKRDLKIVNEIAADLPELQTRIKRAVFLSALGLV